MTKERAISLIKDGYKKVIEDVSNDNKELVSEIINDIETYLNRLEGCDLSGDDIVIVEQLFNRIISVRIDKYIQIEYLRAFENHTLSEEMNSILRHMRIKLFQSDLLMVDWELLSEQIDGFDLKNRYKKLMEKISLNKDENTNSSIMICPKVSEDTVNPPQTVIWYKNFGFIEDDIESISKLESLIGPQPEFDFAMEREDRDIPQMTTELYINCIERRIQEAEKKLGKNNLPLDSFKEISEYINKIKGMQLSLGELALINELYFELITERLYKKVKWIDSEQGYLTIAEDDYASRENMILRGLINDVTDGINVVLYDIIRASIKEGLKYPCPEGKSRYSFFYPEVVSKLESIIGPQPEFDKVMERV